jgi:type IV secretion system protein TrbD
MQAESRRRSVIHQSLVRPVLVLGAERSLAIALWVTVAGLMLPWKGWTAALAALTLATVGHGVLIYLAKIEPQFSAIYIRHYHYRQNCYPARVSIWSLPPSSAPAIIGCWVVAGFMGLWFVILLGHALIIFTICAMPAAYGSWHFATSSQIHPTIPTRRSFF